MNAFFGMIILMGYMIFPRTEDYWRTSIPILSCQISHVIFRKVALADLRHCTRRLKVMFTCMYLAHEPVSCDDAVGFK